MLAYRQEHFVHAAIEGALAQDYPNLEILLSDDASPDGTFAAMQDAVRKYQGPHWVEATQTPRNLGLIEHLRSVLRRAQGELLVFAAGDDISAPRRVSTLVDAWLTAGGGTALLYSNYRFLDGDGQILAESSPFIRRKPPSFVEACRGDLDVHGATTAVTPSVFNAFPPVASDVIYEDRVFPFRALLLGGKVIYVDDTLVDYRAHGGVSRMPLDGSPEAFALLGQRRQLADAHQRLADLLAQQPENRRAVAMCRATIQDHAFYIRMAKANSWVLEKELFQGLLKGARWKAAFRTYARFRVRSFRLRRNSDLP